ncbi:DMT family transporter [Terasakiella pusilla]|uniref:aromatic amino acid exporter YddG n=1 Tax=Terasakiella pusilla TaxID=64973 RepID=UPI003AA9D8D9
MKATLIGGCAILMWSLLALFTSATKGIPQFQLLALTFSVGGLVGLIYIHFYSPSGWSLIRQPWQAWAIGVLGLFGYHFFYFTALSKAPVADASLIAYLWPLLIVLFSAFLPNERLRWFHVLGGVTGLAGALLIVASKGPFTFDAQYGMGYLAAVGCALTWSLYSVLNRTQGQVPTEVVAFFCLATACLGAVCHLAFEEWVSPNLLQWAAIIGLGIGPVGASFYTWDYGTKFGDIRLLGVMSYAAPVLSTLLLVVSGQANADWSLAVACLLITFGAILASLDFFKKKPRQV